MVFRPTFADGNLSHSGHGPEVSRSNRGDLRHDRMDAGVQHGRQYFGGCERGTRAAAGDPVESNRQRGAHLRRRERRSDTSAVRHDEKRLLAADLLLT